LEYYIENINKQFNDVTVASALCPCSTIVSHRQTDRQTDRQTASYLLAVIDVL
jgi:hypothetical protein